MSPPAMPRSFRILVVDDLPDCVASMQLLLGVLGHTCRSAGSGAEALVVAAAFEPEIVLLDIGLPDLSGYEVARALRARQGDRPLYLAAVTGWGTATDQVLALAAGFDHHVLKPPGLDAIQGIITGAASALAQRDGAALPASSPPG